jgi:hypothetical protein
MQSSASVVLIANTQPEFDQVVIHHAWRDLSPEKTLVDEAVQ